MNANRRLNTNRGLIWRSGGFGDKGGVMTKRPTLSRDPRTAVSVAAAYYIVAVEIG